jgi:hypothetical protein
MNLFSSALKCHFRILISIANRFAVLQIIHIRKQNPKTVFLRHFVEQNVSPKTELFILLNIHTNFGKFYNEMYGKYLSILKTIKK